MRQTKLTNLVHELRNAINAKYDFKPYNKLTDRGTLVKIYKSSVFETEKMIYP